MIRRRVSSKGKIVSFLLKGNHNYLLNQSLMVDTYYCDYVNFMINYLYSFVKSDEADQLDLLYQNNEVYFYKNKLEIFESREYIEENMKDIKRWLLAMYFIDLAIINLTNCMIDLDKSLVLVNNDKIFKDIEFTEVSFEDMDIEWLKNREELNKDTLNSIIEKVKNNDEVPFLNSLIVSFIKDKLNNNKVILSLYYLIYGMKPNKNIIKVKE